jgi:hypothetical protein
MTDFYHSPAPLLDDVLDELREAREMVAYLTRANESLTEELRNMRPVHLTLEPKQ